MGVPADWLIVCMAWRPIFTSIFTPAGQAHRSPPDVCASQWVACTSAVPQLLLLLAGAVFVCAALGCGQPGAPFRIFSHVYNAWLCAGASPAAAAICSEQWQAPPQSDGVCYTPACHQFVVRGTCCWWCGFPAATSRGLGACLVGHNRQAANSGQQMATHEVTHLVGSHTQIHISWGVMAVVPRDDGG